MMIIIDDNYAIASDKYCWKIQKSGKAKGEIVWQSIKWYASISQAVRGLAELHMDT